MPDDAARLSIRRHLDHGAPWDACDAFREAVERDPRDPSLLHEGALAHARAGAPHEAHALIERALALSPSPALLVELRSLRGRLWKDRLHRRPGADDAAALARRARDEYLAAHAIAHDPYPAVNAATLSMLLGERGPARELATRAIADLARRPGAPVWDLATSGEAMLLLGDVGAARARYAEAAACAGRDGGVIATMRRQLKLLARVLPDAADVLSALRASDVVAVAGHMIDVPSRRDPRFPPSLASAVVGAVRERVARWHAPAVFGSAASGADLIALEAALDAGAEVVVVLPFERDDFVRTSVAPAGDAWIARFDAVLARAARVVSATDGLHLGDDALFTHASRLVEGLAVLRAAQLETAPTMLAVLDPDSAGGAGGTRESVERWRRHGSAVDVIDLAALRATGAAPPPPVRATAVSRDPHRTIRTLLFADIVGYGRLPDSVIPDVQRKFWDAVARELAATATPARFANTWGDGLYAVFDTPRDGASFALRLADAMGAIRIALHTGPVYAGHDPVIGRDNYFGASVTQAARIEPITPPGTVYTTEAFAATLAADGERDYALEYVGKLALAKGHGESRIYRVSTDS